VRTKSTGDTGFTRKSATRICRSVRATDASKRCVTTITGGQLPTRAINRSSACISLATAVEIDDHHWLVDRQGIAQAVDGAGDDQGGLRTRVKRGVRLLPKRGISRQNDDLARTILPPYSHRFDSRRTSCHTRR
jgi:hypothetical protein